MTELEAWQKHIKNLEIRNRLLRTELDQNERAIIGLQNDIQRRQDNGKNDQGSKGN